MLGQVSTSREHGCSPFELCVWKESWHEVTMALNAEGVPNVRDLRKESQENTQNSKTGKGAPQETPKSSQSPQQRKPFLITFQASPEGTQPTNENCSISSHTSPWGIKLAANRGGEEEKQKVRSPIPLEDFWDEADPAMLVKFRIVIYILDWTFKFLN